MCLRCVFGPDSQDIPAQRAHVLALLALIEHPDAIPANAALRLGKEILTFVGAEPVVRRCEMVPADAPVAPVAERGHP